MYLLSSTADDFLSPCLETITTKVGMSESVAGVTLLAFGNGAPDVMAAIAAAEGAHQGIDASSVVAQMLGSCLFVCTIVVVLVLRAAANQKVKVTRRFFIRDISFYVFTILYIEVALLVYEEVTLDVAFGFLVIYIIFVIVVIF